MVIFLSKNNYTIFFGCFSSCNTRNSHGFMLYHYVNETVRAGWLATEVSLPSGSYGRKAVQLTLHFRELIRPFRYYARSAHYKSCCPHHLCSTKKPQTLKSTRYSSLVLSCCQYIVLSGQSEIFEFRSCILTCFSKNRTWTDDFVFLIPAWRLQFNINLFLENKDKSSLFFMPFWGGISCLQWEKL